MSSLLTKKPRGEFDRLRALLEAFLRADFFTVNASGQAGSSLAASALFQAGFCTIGGALLYLGLPLFHFTVAGLTLTAVMTALVLGPEAGLVLRSNDDKLAGLPASKTTIRTARLLHAILYLILGTAAAAIPIATFAAFAANNILVGFATFAAAIHQTFFFAAATGGADAIMSRVPALGRLRPIVSFAAGGIMVGALIFGIRPLPEIVKFIDSAGDAIVWFPPAWFAAEALLPAAMPPGGGGASNSLIFAAAVSTLAMFILAAVAFCLRAPEQTDKGKVTLTKLAAWFSKTFVKRDEKVTFEFALSIIPRDRDRALKAGPIFAFPAGLLFAAAAIGDGEERRLFVHVLLFVVNAYLPAAVLLLTKSRDARARWIFDTSPIQDPAALRDGFWKATILTVGMPLFVVMQAANAAASGIESAALHILPAFIVMIAVLDHTIQKLPDPFPFGDDDERFSGGAGEGVLALAFFLTILGFAEAWFVRDILASAAATIVLAAYFLMSRRARRGASVAATR
ncbi:MAG: hypothetical protein ACKVS6_07850 [Planctomycetota bacterium]